MTALHALTRRFICPCTNLPFKPRAAKVIRENVRGKPVSTLWIKCHCSSVWHPNPKEDAV